MEGEMEPVFDPSVLPYPIEFIHSGVQCRYFGTENRFRRKFLDENKGWWRPYKPNEHGVDFLQASIEKEVQSGAAPTQPNCETSRHGIRNSSADEGNVASVDELAQHRSPPHKPTSPPTSIKENSESVPMKAEPPPAPKSANRKIGSSTTDITPFEATSRKARGDGNRHTHQERPAAAVKGERKRSHELMRKILDDLADGHYLSHAARNAGVHRKTVDYWIKRSAAGDVGYDLEWREVSWKFHELCKIARDVYEDTLLDGMIELGMGRVVYKTDPFLSDVLGLTGPDAYAVDENGDFIVEAVTPPKPKWIRLWLEIRRPDVWAERKHRKSNIRTGVLIVGSNVPKDRPDKAIEASVKIRQLKALSKRMRDA
jgi:hypothetical protein